MLFSQTVFAILNNMINYNGIACAYPLVILQEQNPVYGNEYK